MQALERAVKGNCGNFLETVGLPAWTVGLAGGALVAGALFITVLLVRRRSRRRSIPM